jgi:putative membrane protein
LLERVTLHGGTMSNRITRGLALAGACALVAACAKSSSNSADTAAGTAALDTTAKTATAAAPSPTLNDTNIFALLDEANSSDSAAGHMAASKGTNASVRDFGRQMERDHHKLRVGGQKLATKLNITPAPPAGDTLASSAQKMSDSLNAQAKGPAWDMAYINNQVAVHQAVLSMLQTAQTAASDSSLKALIASAIPTIQGHLDKAQSIQTKLNSATTATTAGSGSDSTAAAAPTRRGKGKK